jgi:hypothetical protein
MKKRVNERGGMRLAGCDAGCDLEHSRGHPSSHARTVDTKRASPEIPARIERAGRLRVPSRGCRRRETNGGMPRRQAARSRLMISFASLTGVGIVHGSGRRRARWRMMRRLLRRYPEGGEERSGHRARGGARRRRALLAYEQARGREPEELGSLEPRPIVAGQVRSLRRDLHGHRDACRYHTWNRIRDPPLD